MENVPVSVIPGVRSDHANKEEEMFPTDAILLQCNELKCALPAKQLSELAATAGASGVRPYQEIQTGEAYVYFDLPARRHVSPELLSSLQAKAGALLPGAKVKAIGLKRVQYNEGAASGQPIGIHYVVELSYAREVAPELNRWYNFEHLPGLSSVSGCVHSTRFLDQAGRSFACYDLVSAEVPQSPEWMKWRQSEWTSRVNVHYRDIKRGLFREIKA